jgi:hypothetical protein
VQVLLLVLLVLLVQVVVIDRILGVLLQVLPVMEGDLMVLQVEMTDSA